MKVTFVYPDLNYFSSPVKYRGIMSLGIAYLSSSLKKAGHETSLIHIIDKFDRNSFMDALNKTRPQILAFSSLTHQFGLIKELAKLAKNNFNVITVCGGVHPTIDPEESIATEGIDAICRGEGEETLIELCNALEKKEDTTSIKNLWLKKDGKIHKNPVRALEENLDTLPFPDRTLFDYHNIWDGDVRVIQVLAGRGCPYDCSYCCNHQYKALYKNSKYVRFRSPENVITEIKEAKKTYPEAKFVNFLDDTFCLRKDWLKIFLPLYKKEIKLPFHANTRINLLDDELVGMLKDGGAEHLALGVESGNETLRENVLNRKMTNQEIINAFDLGKKYNVKMSSYNMIGLPFETSKEVLETIKLNARENPYSMHVAIFQPYPHTKLYETCKENNLLKENRISSFFGESVLMQDSIKKTEIDFAYFYFKPLAALYKAAYRFPGKTGAVFEKIIDAFYFQKKLHPVFLFLRPLLKKIKQLKKSKFTAES